MFVLTPARKTCHTSYTPGACHEVFIVKKKSGTEVRVLGEIFLPEKKTKWAGFSSFFLVLIEYIRSTVEDIAGIALSG